MSETFAVVWRGTRDDAVAVSRAELLDDRLRLVGSRRGKPVDMDVLLLRISDVQMAAARERIDGRATAMVDMRDGDRLLISAVFGAGATREFAERLVAVHEARFPNRYRLMDPLRPS